MARLPNFTRQNQTPFVPQQQVSLAPQVQAARRTELSGRQLLAEGVRIKDEEQRRANIQWTSEAGAKFREAQAKRYHEAQLSDEEPGGFSDRFMSGFDDLKDKYLNEAPTPDAKIILQRQLDTFRSSIRRQTLGFEAQQLVADRFMSLTETIETMANNVRDNPDTLGMELAGAKEMIDFSASDLTPDKQKALHRMATNKIARSHIDGEIDRNPRRILEQLERGDFDELLTSANKETMVTRAQAEIRRLEAQSQAARRDEYMLLKDLVDDTTEVLVAGKLAAGEEELNKRIEALGGIEAKELQSKLENARRVGDQMSAFVLLPPDVQQQAVNDLELQTRKRETTAKELELLDMMRKSMAHRDQAISNDALSYAFEIGLIQEPAPLNPTDPESLQQRENIARRLRGYWGDAASPFTTEEVDLFTHIFEDSDSLGRLTLMGNLASSWHPETVRSLAKRIAPDNPTLAYSAVMMTQRPAVARMVMRGQTKLDNLPEATLKRSEYSAIVDEYLGEMFSGRPKHKRMIIDSTLAVFAEQKKGRFPESPLNSEDEDILQSSLDIVLGGDPNSETSGLLEYNGSDLVTPKPGLSQSAFSNGIESLQRGHFQAFGRRYNQGTRSFEQLITGEKNSSFLSGLPVVMTDDGPEHVDFRDVIRQGTFESIADGIYRIRYGDGYLFTENGEPYFIDLKSYFSGDASSVENSDTFFFGNSKANPIGKQ